MWYGQTGLGTYGHDVAVQSVSIYIEGHGQGQQLFNCSLTGAAAGADTDTHRRAHNVACLITLCCVSDRVYNIKGVGSLLTVYILTAGGSLHLFIYEAAWKRAIKIWMRCAFLQLLAGWLVGGDRHKGHAVYVYQKISTWMDGGDCTWNVFFTSDHISELSSADTEVTMDGGTISKSISCKQWRRQKLQFGGTFDQRKKTSSLLLLVVHIKAIQY